jgi:hypothetical protein
LENDPEEIKNSYYSDVVIAKEMREALSEKLKHVNLLSSTQ